MDNLTHAFAGALVCDALPYTKRLGSKAPLAAAVVAAAPDLDMVPAFIANFPPTSFSFRGLFAGDWVVRLHRAESHSLFYMALACVPLGFLGWLWSRKKGSFRQWALLFLICFLSHTLLDLMNRWGVRAWLPFSDRRSGFGVLPLIDIPVLVVLGVVFVLNHVCRDGYRQTPGSPSPSTAWRIRIAAWLNNRASPSAVGMIGAIVIAGRIVWALAVR